MRIDAGQHMRMDQQMKLSPRMIQSMEILQLPLMALEERIEQEMEENPVLEMLEVDPDAPDRDAAAEAADADDSRDDQPMVVEDGDNAHNTEDFRRLDDISSQYGDVWDQNAGESAEYRPRVRDNGERDGKMDAMANTAARSASLTDQLLDQWRFVETDAAVHQAGEHVISFIDDDGYLRTDVATMANQAPPGVEPADIERAIPELQRRLEPAGMAARDLRECLLLQLNALIRADEDGDFEDDLDQLQVLEDARELVDGHLKDIEMNRLPRIVKRANLSMPRIQAALARMRRLDPHPGRRLAPESPQVIVPDVLIEYDPVHDRYVAALSRGRTPTLRISPQYSDLSKDRSQERGTRDFLNQKLSSARWLIDSIDQRNNTLLRVVNVVLDVQREFFDHGPEHLKPLPMIQVADQLGIHVGTVSRAVSEKYLQTPRGIFPLRMFFSGGTESDSGEEMSWAAVQAKLKQIIDEEDPKNPMSDDALAEAMKEQGLEIARRTVAKYRQQMNIPTARKRKQY